MLHQIHTNNSQTLLFTTLVVHSIIAPFHFLLLGGLLLCLLTFFQWMVLSWLQWNLQRLVVILGRISLTINLVYTLKPYRQDSTYYTYCLIRSTLITVKDYLLIGPLSTLNNFQKKYFTKTHRDTSIFVCR